jgi:hypothetical protein
VRAKFAIAVLLLVWGAARVAAEPAAAPLGVHALVEAPSNAALKALPHSAYDAVLRIGFARAGDSPPLLMIGDAAPCRMNGGAGDGGAEVATRDGGCWRARFAGYEPDPTDWGAPTDGTDAHDQVQAAIDALAGGVLYTHAGVFTLSRGVVDRATRIVGPRSKTGGGFRAGAANLDLLTISGDNVEIDGLFIDMRGPAPNTSGAAVVLASPGNGRARNLFIEQPCVGIDIEGGVRNVADHNFINDVAGAACAGVMVGRTTYAGGTVDPVVEANTIGSRAGLGGFGVEVFDAGGLHQLDNTILGTAVGTALTPGAGQQVMWGFFRGELGDSDADAALLIDPTAPGAVVKGASFVQIWAASAGRQDIRIENRGSGRVAGLHFDGARVYGGGLGGAVIGGGSDITFDASAFCGAAGDSEIGVAAGVSGLAIRDSTIGGACDGVLGGGSAAAGLRFGGPATEVTISGDDFAGAFPAGASAGPPPADLGSGSRICGNTGAAAPHDAGCGPRP